VAVDPGDTGSGPETSPQHATPSLLLMGTAWERLERPQAPAKAEEQPGGKQAERRLTAGPGRAGYSSQRPSRKWEQFAQPWRPRRLRGDHHHGHTLIKCKFHRKMASTILVAVGIKGASRFVA